MTKKIDSKEIPTSQQHSSQYSSQNDDYCINESGRNSTDIHSEKNNFGSKSFIITLLFVTMYSVGDLVLPFYNKLLFQGFGSDEGFHYPITSSLMQVFCVGICCTIYCICWNQVLSYRQNAEMKVSSCKNDNHSAVDDVSNAIVAVDNDNDGGSGDGGGGDNDHHINSIRGDSTSVSTRSGNHIRAKHANNHHVHHPNSSFFSNFFIKCWELLPVSFLFACIMILSNIGLDKVPLNIHVLLRTTTILWIILLSLFVREIPSLMMIFGALLITAGAVLLSLDLSLGWSFEKGNLLGVAINLVSSLCSGAMTVLLRRVCLRTQDKACTIFQMTVLEITAYKMMLSSIMMVIPAIIVETIMQSPSVWQALIQQYGTMGPVLIGGIFVTLVYQSAVVALTAHARAISVGVLHQLLLLPQLILYTLFNDVLHVLPEKWKMKTLDFTPLQITGSLLIIVGTILYAIIRIIRQYYTNHSHSLDHSKEFQEQCDSLDENNIRTQGVNIKSENTSLLNHNDHLTSKKHDYSKWFSYIV